MKNQKIENISALNIPKKPLTYVNVINILKYRSSYMLLLQIGAAFCGIVVLLGMRKTQRPFIRASRGGSAAGSSVGYGSEIEYAGE